MWEQRKGFSGKEGGRWFPYSHAEGLQGPPTTTSRLLCVSYSIAGTHLLLHKGRTVTSCTVSRWNRAHKHLPSSLKGRLLESKLRVQI